MAIETVRAASGNPFMNKEQTQTRGGEIDKGGHWELLPNLRSTALLISPTHKRTEGRAPVWGSEFTSKDAALQGDPAETAARMNVKLCDLTDCAVTGGAWDLTAYSTRKLKADTEIKSRRGAEL